MDTDSKLDMNSELQFEHPNFFIFPLKEYANK